MGAESLVVGLVGPWPSQQEEAWLQRWNPFGVILFSRNVTGADQLQKLCSHLKSIVPGLQIMADHEGGPVSQLAAALGRPPAAWSLGTIDDENLTRRVHERTAKLMVAAGLSWVLAPCADVMTNPRNPVIGVRAFGNEPEVVSRHVCAAVTGLLEGGIQVCLKHWPGHGSAGQDSHLERTVMDFGTMDEAARPFDGGMAAGATAVMVGHLCAGEKAGEEFALPATLDPVFLSATRKKFDSAGGIKTLLIADDITMGGLRDPMAELGVAVSGDTGHGLLEPTDLPLAWFQALESAGCDLFLLRGLPLGAYPVDFSTGKENSSSGLEPADPMPVVAEYQEARLRGAVHREFFLPDAPVLWIDLTVGDRWVVAAGTSVGCENTLDRVLTVSFGEVLRVANDGAENLGRKTFSRVVLVAHRPLNWKTGDIPTWLESLAIKGEAVVMGHPSLGADFFDALPPELKATWLITAVYDVTGSDLHPEI